MARAETDPAADFYRHRAGRRRTAVAQGRRAVSPRPRPICRRPSLSPDSRGRVRPQPRRPCAASRPSSSRMRHRSGVHSRRSRRRPADPGGSLGRPASSIRRSSHPGDRQGALVGETRRDVRGAARGRRRKTSRPVDAGSRGIAGRRRHAGGAEAGCPRAREWGDNVFLVTFVAGIDRCRASDAPSRSPAKSRTARQCMAPMEGPRRRRQWDRPARSFDRCHRDPDAAHRAHRPRRMSRPRARRRSASSRRTSAAASATRASCCREEVCLGWLALRSGHPVRWIEDRREHLSANANCREHHYAITAYADRAGRLLGIDCEASVDAGAYSVFPFIGRLEAGRSRAFCPGPYDFAGLSLPRPASSPPTSARSCRIAASRAPALLRDRAR